MVDLFTSFYRVTDWSRVEKFKFLSQFDRVFKTRKTLWIILIFIAISILARVLYRADFFPGWDLIGVSDGMYRIHKFGFWESIADSFSQSRHFQYWNHSNSVIFSLLPAWCTEIYPSLYWAHFFTLLSAALMALLVYYYFERDQEIITILALALLSSGALLSHTVTGYPYLSGFLPHLLVIVWLDKYYLNQTWIKRVVIGLLLAELSIHVYELGKTIFVIYFAAILFQKKWSKLDRLYFLVLSAVEFLIIFTLKGANIDARSSSFFTQFDSVILYLGKTFKSFILNFEYDIPCLFLLGLVLVWSIKKDRWFWLSIFGVQFLLVLYEAMHTDDTFRSRRGLLFLCYCLLILGKTYKIVLNQKQQRIVIGVLVLGAFLQLGHMLRHQQLPIETHASHTLPFTKSGSDYLVDPKLIKEAREFSKLLDWKDHKIFVLYDFSTYRENSTDPAAFRERIFLKNGYEKVADRLLFVGDYDNRYNRTINLHWDKFFELVTQKDKAQEEMTFLIYKGDWEKEQRRVTMAESLVSTGLGYKKCSLSAKLENWACYERPKVLSLSHD